MQNTRKFDEEIQVENEEIIVTQDGTILASRINGENQ